MEGAQRQPLRRAEGGRADGERRGRGRSGRLRGHLPLVARNALLAVAFDPSGVFSSAQLRALKERQARVFQIDLARIRRLAGRREEAHSALLVELLLGLSRNAKARELADEMRARRAGED